MAERPLHGKRGRAARPARPPSPPHERRPDWTQRFDAIRFWLAIGTLIVLVWITVPVQAVNAAVPANPANSATP